MSPLVCRFCSSRLDLIFVDLGVTPLANSYLSEADLRSPEIFYPLKAYSCTECLLVQLEAYESPATIFSHYPYRSSVSSSWVAHGEAFAASISNRLNLGPGSVVVEIASNDGCQLEAFARRGVRVLGIEPAVNIAEIAVAKGIPTRAEFFGSQLGADLASEIAPDLVVAKNVLAHVPDLNDFVAGLKALLGKPGCVLTVEVPHLLNLIADLQFDTIYHEHFSYFSLTTLVRVFARHGMTIFDVEELPTHGGSLRIFVQSDAEQPEVGRRVASVLSREVTHGITDLDTYRGFGERVANEKRSIVAFLHGFLDRGLRLAAYGAPAKGNTLFNSCGIGTDMIDFTVDRSPEKQGRFLPGSRIPIYNPEIISNRRPDLVVILPWNLTNEIVEQLSFVREWGGQIASRTPRMGIVN